MIRFDYKQTGGSSVSSNPMIPSYRAKIGTDNDGKEWLCQVSPTGLLEHLMWNVDFDTNDEYWVDKDPEWITDDDGPRDFSSPFLRPEVIYARNYADMNRKRYHRKVVEYKDINVTVNEFAKSHGIE